MLGGGGVSPDDLGYSGSYTLTTGRFGQGISIGLADYLYATDSADLNPGPNGFTLALYTYGIDVQTIGKAGSHIASKYYPENGWYLGSDIDPERIEGGFSGDGRHHELPLFDDTVEGAWRHIVLTFDGVDTAKLYVDGELEVTREDVYFRPSDVPLYFGVASHDPDAL